MKLPIPNNPRIKSFYVGGSSSPEGRARVREVQEILRSDGFSVTWDWTSFEGPPEEIVARDIFGIASADAILLIFENPDFVFRGSFTELGLAIAMKKNVYILGDAGDANIFLNSPLVRKL